jgi:hypothetical protein
MTTHAATTARKAKAEADGQTLIAEIEHLLSFNIGEAALLDAIGYRHKTAAALELRLRRLGRPDLLPRIFEHHAPIYEQPRPGKATR